MDQCSDDLNTDYLVRISSGPTKQMTIQTKDTKTSGIQIPTVTQYFKIGLANLNFLLSILLGCFGLLDVAPLWRLRRRARPRPGAHVQELLQQRHPALQPGKTDGTVHLENPD